jgi:hypothetical protein
LDEKQEWERWRTWLGEDPKNPSIFQDVVSMYAARAIWWGFTVIYAKAPEEARENATSAASSRFPSRRRIAHAARWIYQRSSSRS